MLNVIQLFVLDNNDDNEAVTSVSWISATLLKYYIICCKNFTEFGFRKKTENSVLRFLLANQVFYLTNQVNYSFFTQNQLIFEKIFEKYNWISLKQSSY